LFHAVPSGTLGLGTPLRGDPQLPLHDQLTDPSNKALQSLGLSQREQVS
jgi:hypothetical protein